jgi:hypothetical protein
MAGLPTPEKGSIPRKEQIANRLRSLERAALASTVLGSINGASVRVSIIKKPKLKLLYQDEPTLELKAILKSLRLWGRAADVLQRAKPSSLSERTSRSPSPNPFQVTELKEAIDDITASVNAATKAGQSQLPPQWLSFHRGPSRDGSEWRIAEGLLTNLILIANRYLSRGSFKAAQRYIIDAEVLAISLQSPGMQARALAGKAELFLHSGSYEEAYANIVKASELLTTVCTHPDAQGFILLFVDLWAGLC